MSGFFFCGVMDEPVVKPLSSSINWNSQLDHRMSSSESRDRCIMMSAQALMSSTQKSRSDTPSRLFSQMAEKPSFCASKARSVGYVVPARAQQPMGEASMRRPASARRP